MRITNEPCALSDFLLTVVKKSDYRLEEIPISDQSDWSYQNGALIHRTGGFFNVCGVINRHDPMDKHLMLYQPQSALTGLILHRSDDSIYVLLQARVEPGNTGIIQYGPTIQSTPANYLKLHGGCATHYIEHFTEFRRGTRLLTHSMQLDIGLRYFQKSKTHHYLEVDQLIDTQENMIWASLNAIQGLLCSNNILNADLRSLLAVFDWDRFSEKSSANLNVVTNLNLFGIRSDNACGRLGDYQLVGIDELDGWSMNDDGVVGKDQDGSVSMHRFSCTNREVKSWSQPLYQVGRRGLVQLLMRERVGVWECLIAIGYEPGLSTGHALFPSLLIDPLEDPNNARPIYQGDLIAEIIQCDEGGRFLQNDSIYQLRQTHPNDVIHSDQAWIALSSLHALLQASNRVSFQLRCIASMTLPWMQPASFSDV